MITYTVKPTEKEGEILIEKQGHSHEFTVKDVKTHMEYLHKNKKELTAQAELEEAKLVNLKSFHPFLKDLSDEQITALQLFGESIKILVPCQNKLKEIEAALLEYSTEIEEIKKQTGVEF